jgi:hypothetical protein
VVVVKNGWEREMGFMSSRRLMGAFLQTAKVQNDAIKPKTIDILNRPT